MERFDTRRFWVDLDQRARIIEDLREGRSKLLNYEVQWKTKQGKSIDVLVSYPQVAYRGGHISFVGGKRVLWFYDITGLKMAEEPANAASNGWWRRSRASPRASPTMSRRPNGTLQLLLS